MFLNAIKKYRSKTWLFLFTIFLFISISTVYTIWLHNTLGLGMSLRTILFIIIFSILLTILTSLSTSWIWRIVLFMGMIVLGLYQLINFVYIDIFTTFFSINAGGQMHIPTMLSTIKEFYMIVPWHIYMTTIIYSISMIAVIWWLQKKLNTEQKYLKNHTYVYHISMSFIKIFLLCIILAGGLFLQHYYGQHPRDQWWKYNHHISDKGVYGQLFTNIDEYIVKEIFLDMTFDIALAEAMTQNNGISQDTIDQKKRTPLNYIKEYIYQLESKNTKQETIALSTQNRPLNIVHYQLESIPLWGIKHDPSAMPFLKELIEKYISTEHFFSNGCHTIDAEFATLCSLFPEVSGPISDRGSENDYNCLPQILKENYNYRTAVIHSNTADFWNREVLDPKWGFEYLFFAPEYFDWFKMDDSIALDQAINFMVKSDEPAFVQVIGVSSHSDHTLEDLEGIGKRSGLTMDLFEHQISPEVKNSIEISEEETKIYLSYLINVDRALREFFDALEKNNLLDTTMVIITNDHRYYYFEGGDKQAFLDYNEQPFVIYMPGIDQMKLPITASHIDIAPTILNLLHGSTQAIPDNFLGTSIFDSAHPNSAISVCHNTINYMNQHEIIVGDATTEQYAYMHSDNTSDATFPYMTRALQSIIDLNSLILKENTIY